MAKVEKGTLLKTDGSSESIAPATPKRGYSLSELQGHVGGYIEVVRLPKGKIMLVNEEGLFMGLPMNARASEIAGQVIVGNAVVIPSKDLK